ncbi:MAG TPA: hypothetical protein VG034_00170 [Acidimicrobiia bacterium]|jgi:hypothetical protein|nr:hypothetical protein [Acidimicrobiia bacterium]
MSTPAYGTTTKGFLEEFHDLPVLHKALVCIAGFFMTAIAFEGAFTIVYIVVRWGWDYNIAG